MWRKIAGDIQIKNVLQRGFHVNTEGSSVKIEGIIL
jgi:hypothetical protein